MTTPSHPSEPSVSSAGEMPEKILAWTIPGGRRLWGASYRALTPGLVSVATYTRADLTTLSERDKAVTDEDVERIAKAMHTANVERLGVPELTWEGGNERAREDVRQTVRDCLAALLPDDWSPPK